MIRRGLPLHETKPSQHRRANWQDYGEVGLYMVTLCGEGRQAVFGTLAGHTRAQRGTEAFPHVALSALGRMVRDEEIPKMHCYYPQVEVWQAAIMPDHLHLLLYVREPLPPGKKLGHLISGFKGGCSRAWWALKEGGAGNAAEERRGTAADAAGTAAAAGMAAGGAAGMAEAAGGAAVVPAASAAVKRPSLFEAGYHDRIIKRPGMLENIKRYLADNPLRAIMRRELPRLLERRLHLCIGGHEYAAFGGLFLAKRAEKERVFFHRKDRCTGLPTEQTEAYRHERERLLAEAREGVVLVSPAISKGEQGVIWAAIDEGLPVIHLQKEPIGRYWKPERRRFEACARGTLLILAPWGLDEEIAAGMSMVAGGSTAVGDYARFHRLNDLAAEVCATTEVVLRDVGMMMMGG